MTPRMPAPDHRRENAVLLAAARNDAMAGDTVARLDWEYLTTAAERQGMLPLLQRWLTAQALPVPSETTSALTASYWLHFFHTRTLLAELAAIRAAAAAIGIPLLPLKGAALAPTVYAAPELRPMSDLDLLCRPDDLARVRAILGDLGYAEEEWLEPPPLPPRLRDPLRQEWHFVATRGGFPVRVELRTEPLDPGLQPLTELDRRLSARLHAHAADMWSRACASGANLTDLSATPEDLLLHVASHMATRHADFRLIWLVDLRQIVAHAPAFDWEYLARKARTLDITVPTHVALQTAARWVNLSLPLAWTGATSRLAPRRFHLAERLEAMALAPRGQQIASADLAAIPPSPAWLAAVSVARVSWVARARTLRWLLLPSRDYLAGWRNTPERTTGWWYVPTAAFRLLVSLLQGSAIIARRLRIPLLPGWVDRLTRRINPFGKYIGFP